MNIGTILALLTGSIFLLAACSAGSNSDNANEESVVGSVTMDFVRRLALALSEGKTPVVTSSGGETVAGLTAANLLISSGARIIVEDYCFSSCASYVLVGASHVEFRENAMVGFHHDAHLDYNVYSSAWPGRGCYQRSYDKEREIYASHSNGEQFLSELYERLSPSISAVAAVEDESDLSELCTSVSYELTNQYWFPTSQQIEEFMGIEVEGSLCADDHDCMRRRLRNLHITGTVVVGDDIWTLPED